MSRSDRSFRLLRAVLSHDMLISCIGVEAARNTFGSLETLLHWRRDFQGIVTYKPFSKTFERSTWESQFRTQKEVHSSLPTRSEVSATQHDGAVQRTGSV